MDFIEKLPNSHGKIVIMVVVDKISKYVPFMALSHPFTTSQAALAFLDGVYKLHRLLEAIISDRDKVFVRNFLKALFGTLKLQFKLSTVSLNRWTN